MNSRLRQEFKIMWSNVWFRSLAELVAVVIGLVLFMLILQSTSSGRQVIDEVKQQLPTLYQ